MEVLFQEEEPVKPRALAGAAPTESFSLATQASTSSGYQSVILVCIGVEACLSARWEKYEQYIWCNV